MTDGLRKFLSNSAIKVTCWYIDAETDQLVCLCKSCGAEARLTTENCHEFQFAHKDSCPHSDRHRA
jgi:hypothetical protein